MLGRWQLTTGDEVFIEAKEEFYKPFLKGWFNVSTVSSTKNRFTIQRADCNEGYKMFRNRHGICCVVEHEYDKYGNSTWDDAKQQYRFIFVPVDLFVKAIN